MARSKGRTGRPWRRARARLRRQRRQPCALCGQPIDYTLPDTDPQGFTADHIIPIALDPDDRHATKFNNLQPAHRTCNTARGTGQAPTTHTPNTRW